MVNLPLGVHYIASEGVITGYPASERWLSQLADSFCDQSAYQSALAAGDALVYRVSTVDSPSGPGQLQYGLGLVMPGLVGQEYYMTRGHVHTFRAAAEVYICLEGSGLMLLENIVTGQADALPLTPQQLVYVPGDTAHRTINTGDTPLVYWGVFPYDAGHDYAYVRQNNFRQVVVAVNGQPEVLERETYQKQLAERSR